MDQLRQSDTKRLLDFVSDCYAIRESEPPTDFPRKLVKALLRLIPSIHATYNEVCTEKFESYNTESTAESFVPDVSKLLGQHMNEHPSLAYYMQTGDGRATRISDFLSRRQFHDTGLYHDFYRDCHIEDDLCFGIFVRPTLSIGIVWHGDSRFTERERCMANLIRPHVVQAWQNARLLSELHSELQMLEDGLEGTALGVIACDWEGRVHLITALARQYLAEYFGATKNLDRQLPQELLRFVRCQHAQLNKIDLPPVRLPLYVQKGDNRLAVRMLSSAGANLLLLDETTSARNAAARARRCLSQRESEVLSWAAQGKTNGEIATILGMSPQTAKKHMEHILHKLGVPNRAAAAALAPQALARDA
jgi:DNA-binding CsgD family transcriptional regulator